MTYYSIAALEALKQANTALDAYDALWDQYRNSEAPAPQDQLLALWTAYSHARFVVYMQLLADVYTRGGEFPRSPVPVSQDTQAALQRARESSHSFIVQTEPVVSGTPMYVAGRQMDLWSTFTDRMDKLIASASADARASRLSAVQSPPDSLPTALPQQKVSAT